MATLFISEIFATNPVKARLHIRNFFFLFWAINQTGRKTQPHKEEEEEGFKIWGFQFHLCRPKKFFSLTS